MAHDIVFICWKWAAPYGTRRFLAEHVNVWGAMLARHAPFPHRLVCITDDPTGLDATIDAFPMPQTGYEHIIPPTRRRDTKEWPSCYRRLWLFSEKAKELGDRLVSLDIDVIVTNDLTPLVAVEGHFVGWCDVRRFGWNKIAGGAYMLTPGTHVDVWEDFDPDTSPQMAAQAGCQGSDQGWMSFKIKTPDASWTARHGLVKLGWLPRGGLGPGPGVRLVFTSGLTAPWMPATQRRHPWIRTYWTR